MRTALLMLAAAGFEAERKLIDAAWRDFIAVMGYHPTAEYRQAYPEALLSKIVSAAKEGIEGIGVVTAKPDALTPVVGLLNSAWQEFWRAPKDYQAWEAIKFEGLRTSVNATQ